MMKVSDYLGFGLTPQELEMIIKKASGTAKRDLTWDEFNEHITKKVEKKTNFF